MILNLFAMKVWYSSHTMIKNYPSSLNFLQQIVNVMLLDSYLTHKPWKIKLQNIINREAVY